MTEQKDISKTDKGVDNYEDPRIGLTPSYNHNNHTVPALSNSHFIHTNITLPKGLRPREP